MHIVILYTYGTLLARDYNSFAAAILSQNHREIDVAESISVSIKGIICLYQGFFPIMMSCDSLDIDNMAANLSLTGGGVENHYFWLQGISSPLNLI